MFVKRIDLQKIFGTIDPNKLLQNMKAIGFYECTLTWFKF